MHCRSGPKADIYLIKINQRTADTLLETLPLDAGVLYANPLIQSVKQMLPKLSFLPQCKLHHSEQCKFTLYISIEQW